MKQLNTKLDDSLHQKLKMLSTIKNITIQELLDEAIKDILEKYKDEQSTFMQNMQ